jgi:DNA-directed RNA polymerase I subunit RPA1
VAGVLLTKRDTFLTRAQYMQLLYAACCSSRPGADAAAAVGSLAVPPPAIWRPQPLYTGKQVELLNPTCTSLIVATL